MRSSLHRLPLYLCCLALVAGCSSAAGGDAAGQGDSRYQIVFDRRERSYVVHVPPGAARTPTALVIGLHGGGGNAQSFQQQTHLSAQADLQGFVVAYPNGTGKSRPLLNALGKGFLYTWNAGSCCGYARDHGVDDVGFIRSMVGEIRQKYPIDPQRIYAAGISNGGMLAYRLACEASDLFAAIGVVSGAQAVARCAPAQPVSVIHFHGTADQNVPLAGGVGRKGFDKVPKPAVLDAINFWARVDGASDPESRSQGKLLTQVYRGDRGDVVLCLITGGGHAWPGGERLTAALDLPDPDIAATPSIWQFFLTHPKP